MFKLDCFGPCARFHHVGIAVPSIEKACSVTEKTRDPIQKVSVAFLSLNGLCVELIEPEGDNSPVNLSLKKDVKLLHLCYSVRNLEEALAECENRGFHRISHPVPAAAFDNRRIVWVYSNTYGLFELLEDPQELEN